MARQGKKTRSPGWIPGQHWLNCERCGFNYRHKDMKKQWDNRIVCAECWEPRQPQDFVRGVPDNQQAEGLVRTEPADVFVDVTFVDNSEQLGEFGSGTPPATNSNSTGEC